MTEESKIPEKELIERTAYVIYVPTRGFVGGSAKSRRYVKSFSEARTYVKKNHASCGLSHNERELGAVVMDVRITLDPEKIFLHLLVA